MKLHIKTLHGLEEILAKETTELGGKNVQIHKRSISCEGNLEFLYKANYHLRTALKILVPIYSFQARNEDELYKQVYQFDWTQHLSLHQTFAIDNTIFSEYFKHSKFAALKTKDAIVDQFRNKLGKRPSVDIKNPDIQFDLYAFKDQFTISLDSSGATLNQRGYRGITKHQAPMNEVLGAGLVHLSGWKKDIPLVDPMCGTGTILIEAALMACNVPPQIIRSHFGFKNWSSFEPTIWNRVVTEGKAGIRTSQQSLTGGDIDRQVLKEGKEAMRKLRMPDLVTFREISFEKHHPSTPDGMLISNPPYGERIGRLNTNEFYSTIGDALKQNFDGFDAWLLSSNMEAFKHVRLRPSKKIVLFNGPLECKFQKYEMYKGTRE